MQQEIVDEVKRTRELKGTKFRLCFFLSLMGLLLSVGYIFHLDYLIFKKVLMEQSFLALLIVFFVPQVFLYFPATKKSPMDRVPLVDWILAMAAFISPMWIVFNARLIQVLGLSVIPPIETQVAGVILMLILLEACRRTTGLGFISICLFFALYPLFAGHMPGFLVGKSYSFSRVVGFHYLGTESVFGLPMHVFGRLIVGFIVFAIVLQISKGSQFFLDLAQGLLGRVRGGPAKVSIVASAFFGSLSGSVISNIVTTGAVTIPTMKKVGYPAYYAAAVEACASTGGVLMPPIMGVTAFIMAEYLDLPYIHIVVAAVLPSFFYFFGLILQTDFHAAREGLAGLPEGESLPDVWKTLRSGWPYYISFAVLMFILVYLWNEAMAPWISALVLIVLAMIKRETRWTKEDFIRFINDSGKTLCELTAILSCVGVIVGSVMLTGMGFALSEDILVLAGGNTLLLLVLGALTAAILGVGMTISACYIILAIILAPPLVNAGLDPLAVHLFIMYFGMISYITPPVAIGAYAAAGLAGAPGMKTGLHAMKLGTAIYIVPFFFVLNPALIFHGTWLEIFWGVVTVGMGLGLLAAGFERYIPGIGVVPRAVTPFLLISGLLVAYPSLVFTVAGVALSGITIVGILLVRKFYFTEQESGD